MINLTTLPSGLRVITDHVESMHSVALGIWTHVGTRDENPSHNGAAHLVEHMLFKGTPSRSTFDIAEAIERVGGNVNAYTSREITSYHTHMLKDDMGLGLEVLADIYQNATMPEDELEKERHVVLQEIGMSLDTPDDLVFDMFYETAYPQQMLGAPILGRAEIIRAMPRDALAAHVGRFYNNGRTVISAAGGVDHDAFVQHVAQQFSALPAGQDVESVAAAYRGGENRQEKPLEQAHIVLGFQGVRRAHPDYYAVQALSTILGGGMASRLFQEVREKRGLVYSVYTFHSAYYDCGLFGVYAGTGAKDLPELMPILCDEILKITQEIREDEVARARAQLKADLLMARESMMTRADQMAKNLIFKHKKLDIAERIARIAAVDAAAIKAIARQIFASPPTLAALGPLGQLESFDQIKRRLAA